jgi:hypothetical protein
MRVLFFVEPLVMHGRPFHYWAWLYIYADMCRTLRSSGWEARVVVNEALATRALAPLGTGHHYAQLGRGLLEREVVVLDQTSIRRIFDRPNIAILECLRDGDDDARTSAYGELLRSKLGGFVPDVMMSVTPAPQLARAFPEALLLATETAAYSRSPYPMSMFFDPGGLWDASMPARETEALSLRTPTPQEDELLSSFRRRFDAYFRATTPFAELERELRRDYDRLAFLPLQFGGESGFDLNGPFRNQGEYLFHVLEQLPRDIGLLVVEHPTAHWIGDIIDDETRTFLRRNYPHVHFVDLQAAASAGQYLVHHADFVISLSTSLAIQGLLFGRPLVSVGHSHLSRWSQVKDVENLPRAVPKPPRALDGLLSWLLSHYFVPVELTRDPTWLVPFLIRCAERARKGSRGPEFFDPVLPPEHLSRLLFRELDMPPLRAELVNGDLTRWSSSAAGVRGAAITLDGWQLIDPSGVAVLSPGNVEHSGAACVRIQRPKAGAGPTLFLQRVPDLTRSAGTLARLRFRARASASGSILAYFYLQLADGGDCFGSAAGRIEVGTEWRSLQYVAQIPALGERRPGPGNHLEVVLGLPSELGAATLEVADLSLEPVPL